MGRQINFYAQPEDMKVLVDFILGREDVVISTRDGNEAETHPLSYLDALPQETLFFWRRDMAPTIEREWVSDPGYFRIDSLHLPVLELSASFTCEWEGTQAIGLGRIYGQFDAYLEKPAAFSKWYDQICRWIRRNWRSSPVGFGGYIATAAYSFYERGGLLLPAFKPPPTSVWKAELAKQHKTAAP